MKKYMILCCTISLFYCFFSTSILQILYNFVFFFCCSFFPVEGTNIKQHFTFFNVERTWTEAKVICEDRGMNLLKLETIQETDYVIELITNELGITTL